MTFKSQFCVKQLFKDTFKTLEIVVFMSYWSLWKSITSSEIEYCLQEVYAEQPLLFNGSSDIEANLTQKFPSERKVISVVQSSLYTAYWVSVFSFC